MTEISKRKVPPTGGPARRNRFLGELLVAVAHSTSKLFQNTTGTACSLFARAFDFAYRMVNPNFVSVEVVL
jgi:hypothetical protein